MFTSLYKHSTRYRFVILIGSVIALITSYAKLELISPLVIFCAGLLIGILLISLAPEEDQKFLLGLFLAAYLSRIFISIFLYNLTFVFRGTGLAGDGWGYSENGYAILQLWRHGITNIDEIHRNVKFGSVSGALGSYDFWNAIVYFFTGKSPLSLVFINCLAGSIIVFFIYAIAKQLFNKTAAIFASILTAFWPSLFLWSTKNLKEPIAVFLLVTIVWCIVRLNKQFRFYLIFLLILLSLALREFRIILFFVFFAVIFPCSLALYMWKVTKLKVIYIVILFFIAGFLVNIAKSYFAGIFPSVENVALLDWMYQMRTWRAYGGSAFLEGWNFTNPFVLFLFAPIALFIALLAPFPWQLGSISKIITMPEMLIYYLLIPFMFSGAKFLFKYKLRESALIITYICVMILVLAFVEGNVGTLFRHRAVVLPFMFVLTGVGLAQKYRFKKA